MRRGRFYVLDLATGSATEIATAAWSEVGDDGVSHELAVVKQGAMVGAESAGDATCASTLGDGHAVGKVDEVFRVDIAVLVILGRRNVASVELSDQLSLNLRVVDGR
jgi:hypothetical protein